MGARLIQILAAGALVLAVVLAITGGESPLPSGPERPEAGALPRADSGSTPALPDAEGPADAEATGAILVRVTATSERKPVAGVRASTAVDGFPTARMSTRTDSEGCARFEGLPAGNAEAAGARFGPLGDPFGGVAEQHPVLGQ